MAVALPLTRQEFNDIEQLKFKQSVARTAGVSSDAVSIDRIVDMNSILPALRRLLTTGIRVDTSVQAPNETTAIAISTGLTLDSLNSALVEVGLSATTILEAGSPDTHDPGTVYVPPTLTIPDTTPAPVPDATSTTPVRTTTTATTMRTWTTTLALTTTRAPAATTPTPVAFATTPRPVPATKTPTPAAVVTTPKRALTLTTPTPALVTAPEDAQIATVVGVIVGGMEFFCCVTCGCLWWQTRKPTTTVK
jgi:hypothetical protein